MTWEEITNRPMTREEAIKQLREFIILHQEQHGWDVSTIKALDIAIKALEQQPKMGHCKDCKYFEYDSVAKIDGIPLIIDHEICSKWSDGCKTKEDGYCFLFEPQESEDKE